MSKLLIAVVVMGLSAASMARADVCYFLDPGTSGYSTPELGQNAVMCVLNGTDPYWALEALDYDYVYYVGGTQVWDSDNQVEWGCSQYQTMDQTYSGNPNVSVCFPG